MPFKADTELRYHLPEQRQRGSLTLRLVFRLALRQTKGLLGSIIAVLGLDPPCRTRQRATQSFPKAQANGCRSGTWDWQQLNLKGDNGSPPY